MWKKNDCRIQRKMIGGKFITKSGPLKIQECMSLRKLHKGGGETVSTGSQSKIALSKKNTIRTTMENIKQNNRATNRKNHWGKIRSPKTAPVLV